MLVSSVLIWKPEETQPWSEQTRTVFQKNLIIIAKKVTVVKFIALLVKEDAMKKFSTRKEEILSFSMENGLLLQGKTIKVMKEFMWT